MIDPIIGTSGVAGLTAPQAKHHHHHVDPFQQADADGNGNLSQPEVQNLLADLSQKTGKTINLQDFMKAVDTNGDGVIDTREFAAGRDKVKALLGGNQSAGTSTSSNFQDVLQQLTLNQSSSNTLANGNVLQTSQSSSYPFDSYSSNAGTLQKNLVSILA
jgi:hypothetical protein